MYLFKSRFAVLILLSALLLGSSVGYVKAQRACDYWQSSGSQQWNSCVPGCYDIDGRCRYDYCMIDLEPACACRSCIYSPYCTTDGFGCCPAG